MFEHGLRGMFIVINKSKIPLLSFFAFIAMCLSVILDISLLERIIVLYSISLVFCLEMINTSIELICNMIDTSINPQIKDIKDIMAGTVFFFSLSTGIVGLIIFLPKLVKLC